jgi:hypothetical protein
MLPSIDLREPLVAKGGEGCRAYESLSQKAAEQSAVSAS